MYLLILFQGNLGYVFLSFDWIKTIIIIIINVGIYRVHLLHSQTRIRIPRRPIATWYNITIVKG